MKSTRKSKKPVHQHQAEGVFLMLSLLLVVIILLLVSPWRCKCRVQADSYGNPGAPVAVGGTPANPTSTTPIKASDPMWLSPQSGPIGTVVTVHGWDFGVSNTILLNGLVSSKLKNVVSSDGKTLQFVVPSTIGPNCQPGEMCAQFLVELTSGSSYSVSVITGSSTQNVGTFTVRS